jgi:hypothetical protein
MKRSIISFLALALAIAIPPSLWASTVKGAETVEISEPVDGNLYAGGGKVKINAPVAGDAFVGGGEVWINDQISKDVLAAGGSIIIQGTIGEDLRVMGGRILVKENIGGDLVVAGGEVEVINGVIISGDLIVAGGKVVFNGIVKGKAKLTGGELIFNGISDGGLELKAGKVEINGEVNGPSSIAAGNISLGSKARFLGDVEYWQEHGEINFEGRLYNEAKATYNPDLKFNVEKVSLKKLRKGLGIFMVYRFAAAAFLIILLVLLLNRFLTRNAGRLSSNYLTYLGNGALFFIGVPVMAVIALATIIGIPVGLVLLSSVGIALIIGNTLTAVVGAYELENNLNRNWGKGMLILTSIGLYAAIRVIAFIPVLGGLASFALMMIAFGFLIYSLTKKKSEPEPELL